MEFKVKKIDLHVCLIAFIVSVIFCLSEFNQVEFLKNIGLILEGYKIKYLIILLLSIGYITPIVFGKKQKLMFLNEFKLLSCTYLVFFLVSVIFELKNGFKPYLFTEILYYFVPVIFSFAVINRFPSKLDLIINTVFYTMFAWWLLIYAPRLNLQAILNLSIANSYSQYESGFAFYMFVFLIYFLYKKNILNTMISLFVTILSLKRIILIMALIAVIYLNPFQKRNKEVSKRYIDLITLVFVFVPVLIQFLCSETFSDSFFSVTGIPLNYFVKGRIERINLCLEEGMKYGFGSTNEYLTNYYNNRGFYFENTYFLHSDIMRIYLETTIVGTIVFTRNIIRLARKNIYSLFLVTALLIDMVGNHYFGPGTTFFWFLFYLVIYCVNSTQIDSLENTKNNYPN